jgi:hypothetical protein
LALYWANTHVLRLATRDKSSYVCNIRFFARLNIKTQIARFTPFPDRLFQLTRLFSREKAPFYTV